MKRALKYTSATVVKSDVVFQDTFCITCSSGKIISVITELVMRALQIPGKLLRENSTGLVTVFSDKGQGSRKKHEASMPDRKEVVKQLTSFQEI